MVLPAAVPVLDEESYLDIALQLDPYHPYDWWRPWPPWGLAREADAFVYAHPPGFLVWVWAWVKAAGGVQHIVPLKVAAGLPWAALLGWSVGRLAERTTRRPYLVASLWAANPIVVLGIQRGLMPDLMLTALMTSAVVAWVEGIATEEAAAQRRWWIGGGLALAGAVSVKYSALVVVPALLLHQRTRQQKPSPFAFWLTFGILWAFIEGWLALLYGRLHLWEVLSRAGEVGHSSPIARLLGVCVRLGVAALFLPLLTRPWLRFAPWMVVGAMGLSLVGAPDGSSLGERFQAAVWALPGLAAIAWLVGVVVTRRGARSEGAANPEVLLGAWALAVVVGVGVGHNFASPRYLLPAMAPIVLLMVRVVAQRPLQRALAYTSAVISAVIAISWTWAEHRFFDAADGAARAVAVAHPEGGCFTGEWSFRHRMQAEGWTFCGDLADMNGMPSGSLVAVPVHSSPGAIPDHWQEVDSVELGWGPVHLVDARAGVGWYGESLGVLPVRWGQDPMEEVTVWRIP